MATTKVLGASPRNIKAIENARNIKSEQGQDNYPTKQSNIKYRGVEKTSIISWDCYQVNDITSGQYIHFNGGFFDLSDNNMYMQGHIDEMDIPINVFENGFVLLNNNEVTIQQFRVDLFLVFNNSLAEQGKTPFQSFAYVVPFQTNNPTIQDVFQTNSYKKLPLCVVQKFTYKGNALANMGGPYIKVIEVCQQGNPLVTFDVLGGWKVYMDFKKWNTSGQVNPWLFPSGITYQDFDIYVNRGLLRLNDNYLNISTKKIPASNLSSYYVFLKYDYGLNSYEDIEISSGYLPHYDTMNESYYIPLGYVATLSGIPRVVQSYNSEIIEYDDFFAFVRLRPIDRDSLIKFTPQGRAIYVETIPLSTGFMKAEPIHPQGQILYNIDFIDATKCDED